MILSNNKKKRVQRIVKILIIQLFILMSIIIFSSLNSCAHPQNQDANNGGTGSTETNGNWFVDSGDNLLYENQTIIVNGNLTINSTGTLTIRNITLIMNSTTKGKFHIEVKNKGELYILGQRKKALDFDLTIGDGNGTLNYYENTGTSQNPKWSENTTMYSGIKNDYWIPPVFADLDNDFDFDLTTGREDGGLNYFKNIGNPSTPEWIEDTSMYSGIDVGDHSAPTFADLDNDGDFDMVIGVQNGRLNYYENIGSVSEGEWNPRGRLKDKDDKDIYNEGWSTPAFADLDNDSDIDLTIGAYSGMLYYYENTGNSSNPEWTERTTMYEGIDVGSRSAPAFTDLDNDGDFDLTIGNRDGDLWYYENTGNSTHPVWTEKTSMYDEVDIGEHAKPAFADLDNDGITGSFMNGCNITANNTDYAFLFWVNKGAIFVMKNSELHGCGYSSSENKHGLYIQANNTLIEGNLITDNYYGLVLQESQNNIIRNNIFLNKEDGIKLLSSNNNKIINNNISDIMGESFGIILESSHNNSLINNICSNNWFGIYLRFSENNTLINNTCTNNNDGIYMDSSNNNSIINNICNLNKNQGIYMPSSNYNNITNNNCSCNKWGISTSGFSNTITNNICNLNTHVGIFLYNFYKTILNNNTCNSNEYGVIFSSSCNETISNFTITNSSSYDLGIYHDSHPIVLNTTFNDTKIYFYDEKSSLTVKWYLHIRTVDKNLNIIKDANITIKDKENKDIYRGITDVNGFVNWVVCNQFEQNQSNRIYYTPHTIIIEKKGVGENISVINMTESKQITLVLELKEPYDIKLICKDNKGFVSPGESIKYIFNITNFGSKADTIFLEHSIHQNWIIYLNRTAVPIVSLGTVYVMITVQAPSDALALEQSIIEITGTSYGDFSIKDTVITITTVNQIHDISFSSDKDTEEIKPGRKIFYNFTIENNGNGFEKLNLTLNSTASDCSENWTIEQINSTINLNSTESETILVSVTPPKNAKANDKVKIVFDLISLTQNKTISTKTIEITVNQIPNITIEPEKTELHTNPGKEVNCTINITNNGNGNETIRLEISGKNSNWGYLNISQINLGVDKTKQIELTVEPPDYAVAGTQVEIEILAFTPEKTFNSTTIVTTVNQIHSISIDLIGEYSTKVNPGEIVEYQIKIKNNGNEDDTVKLTLSGENSEWGEIEKEVFMIRNEEKTITLKVTPPNNAKTDEKAKIIISAYSGYEFLDSIETTTKVNQIYDISLEIDKNHSEVKPSEIAEYKITVKNLGNGKDTIRLELFGLNSNWAWFSESIITLESKQSKTITLNVAPPKSAVADEKAIIRIQAIFEYGVTSNLLSTTTTVTMQENKEPIADFKIFYKNNVVTKVKIGKLITFDASNSVDEDGKIEVYQWDFDNGDIRYNEKIDYTYPKDTKPGKYTITLKVTDDIGITTEKQMTIEVFEENEEINWILYLILVVILIIGLLIVIMLVKVVKALKHLGEIKKSAVPITEKVGMSTFEEEKRKKEEQKRKEIEMWKPLEKKEEKPESIVPEEKEEIKEFEEMKEEKEEENEDFKESPKEMEDNKEIPKKQEIQEKDVPEDLKKMKKKEKVDEEDWWENWESNFGFIKNNRKNYY